MNPQPAGQGEPQRCRGSAESRVRDRCRAHSGLNTALWDAYPASPSSSTTILQVRTSLESSRSSPKDLVLFMRSRRRSVI